MLAVTAIGLCQKDIKTVAAEFERKGKEPQQLGRASYRERQVTKLDPEATSRKTTSTQLKMAEKN